MKRIIKHSKAGNEMFRKIIAEDSGNNNMENCFKIRENVAFKKEIPF
jgi:hypothetical protein